MNDKIKENNHLYPQLHLRYWKNLGAKKYLIKDKKIINLDIKCTFSKKRYYSNGKPNDILENRIAVFEQYIGELIKKINEANDCIQLTGKEVEILKLYVYLCGCRQEYSTEVIKDDSWGIYRSNNYLYGMPKVFSIEEVIKITEMVLNEFEKLKTSSNENTIIDYRAINKFSLTSGLHLAIIRAEGPLLIISDRYCIIENTMDSDHLYSYVPITPTTALLLVKTKYYLDEETFRNSKKRLSLKYGGNGDDPWMSAIFGAYIQREDLLFCSYAWIKLAPSLKNEYILQKESKNPTIKIGKCPTEIVDYLNSIFIEDGKEAIFCDEEALKRAVKGKLVCRHIE